MAYAGGVVNHKFKMYKRTYKTGEENLVPVNTQKKLEKVKLTLVDPATGEPKEEKKED